MIAARSSLLGVNIDHVATIRQARLVDYPDIVQAALAAEEGGADGITVHLREDRRHIQDLDVRQLKERIATRLNLEMAVTDEMLRFACQVRPAYVCLVPEKRRELTTEGGLDVVNNHKQVARACRQLGAAGIGVSLFIDPHAEQIRAAHETGAACVELHTGIYANAAETQQDMEARKLFAAAQLARRLKLVVNAGHGLHYANTRRLATSGLFNEFNIGHSIVAQALFVGMKQATRKMKDLLQNASGA